MKKLTPTYKQYLQRKSEKAVAKRNAFSKLVDKRKRALLNQQKRIERAEIVKLFAPENFVLGFTKDDAEVGYRNRSAVRKGR